MAPGATLGVSLPDGRVVQVAVPPGAAAGSAFHVVVPP